MQAQSKLRRELFLPERALQAPLQHPDGRLDMFQVLALESRDAVHAADAVENRSANLVLRVRLELHVELRIEIVDGVDQADDSDGDQVLETGGIGKLLVNSRGH